MLCFKNCRYNTMQWSVFHVKDIKPALSLFNYLIPVNLLLSFLNVITCFFFPFYVSFILSRKIVLLSSDNGGQSRPRPTYPAQSSEATTRQICVISYNMFVCWIIFNFFIADFRQTFSESFITTFIWILTDLREYGSRSSVFFLI